MRAPNSGMTETDKQSLSGQLHHKRLLVRAQLGQTQGGGTAHRLPERSAAHSPVCRQSRLAQRLVRLEFGALHNGFD